MKVSQQWLQSLKVIEIVCGEQIKEIKTKETLSAILNTLIPLIFAPFIIAQLVK